MYAAMAISGKKVSVTRVLIVYRKKYSVSTTIFGTPYNPTQQLRYTCRNTDNFLR